VLAVDVDDGSAPCAMPRRCGHRADHQHHRRDALPTVKVTSSTLPPQHGHPFSGAKQSSST
jgi:hypothetical protein